MNRLTRLAYDKVGAANELCSSVTRIDQFIAEGKLKAVKLGKRVLIPAAELERLLDELPPAEIRDHSNSQSAKDAREAARARGLLPPAKRRRRVVRREAAEA